MLTRPFSYLFSISYLGARFKGWAKQPQQPTVEGKLDRVLRFVLGEGACSFISASRTDSGVSCRQGFVQLFAKEKLDIEGLMEPINTHLGGEIRLAYVRELPRDFNLIQEVSQKTYRYFFADATGFPPFSGAFVTAVPLTRSLAQMQDSAACFLGRHNFKAFCQPSPTKSTFVRVVDAIAVFEATDFPQNDPNMSVFCVEVKGSGFLHHQVRKMVQAIWQMTPEQINARLAQPEADWEPVPTASANGLILWETRLKSS
jgi:tRNA pseudouridine38-40 synthase